MIIIGRYKLCHARFFLLNRIHINWHIVCNQIIRSCIPTCTVVFNLVIIMISKYTIKYQSGRIHVRAIVEPMSYSYLNLFKSTMADRVPTL